mmetsp:Transcript_64740/g.90053  ORF Transcript_64740/g.90053 Transcript_64740/m.90053 type:complete len:232 (+) Transcript_64740:52-747(+)
MTDLDQAQLHVINISNYGVSLIQQGQYGVSIPVLSEALRLCRGLMDQAEDFDGSLGTSLDACMEESRCSRQILMSDAREGGRPNGEKYLYQQAVSIPLDIGSSYRASVMVSTMVTFNLALANQLASMNQTGEDSKLMLHKAAKLYELAFSMQQEEEFDCNTLFTLATINNLGLVHSQLNDRTSANKCFEYLLSSLMYLTNASGQKQPSREFDGFFRNASSSIQSSRSAPAA